MYSDAVYSASSRVYPHPAWPIWYSLKSHADPLDRNTACSLLR